MKSAADQSCDWSALEIRFPERLVILSRESVESQSTAAARLLLSLLSHHSDELGYLWHSDTAVFVATPANIGGGDDATDDASPDCNLIHSLATRDSQLIRERMGGSGSER